MSTSQQDIPTIPSAPQSLDSSKEMNPSPPSAPIRAETIPNKKEEHSSSDVQQQVGNGSDTPKIATTCPPPAVATQVQDPNLTKTEDPIEAENSDQNDTNNKEGGKCDYYKLTKGKIVLLYHLCRGNFLS